MIGLFGAGKTVLITSLINHLKQHNKDRFPLKRRGRELSIVELRRRQPMFGRPFNYEHHRSRMVNDRWPDKTVQLEEYRAIYSRKGSGGRLDLSLLDIPGERLGDITIADHNSFEGWSNATLNAFDSFPEFEVPAKPFHGYLHEAQTSGNVDEAHLLMLTARHLLTFSSRAYPSSRPPPLLCHSTANRRRATLQKPTTRPRFSF